MLIKWAFLRSFTVKASGHEGAPEVTAANHKEHFRGHGYSISYRPSAVECERVQNKR